MYYIGIIERYFFLFLFVFVERWDFGSIGNCLSYLDVFY